MIGMLVMLGLGIYAIFYFAPQIENMGPKVGDTWVWTMPDRIDQYHESPEELKGLRLYRKILKIDKRNDNTYITWENTVTHMVREQAADEFTRASEKLKPGDSLKNIFPL